MIDTLTLDSDHRSAKRARAFISAHLAGHHHEVIENATLMVSELVTNSLRHATGAINLTLEVTEDIVRVEVNDAGPAAPLMRTPTPADPTGRGLQIVAHLSDEWGFNQTTASGNHVWFVIQLEHAREGHANETRPASRDLPLAIDSIVSAPSVGSRDTDEGTSPTASPTATLPCARRTAGRAIQTERLRFGARDAMVRTERSSTTQPRSTPATSVTGAPSELDAAARASLGRRRKPTAGTPRQA